MSRLICHLNNETMHGMYEPVFDTKKKKKKKKKNCMSNHRRSQHGLFIFINIYDILLYDTIQSANCEKLNIHTDNKLYD